MRPTESGEPASDGRPGRAVRHGGGRARKKGALASSPGGDASSGAASARACSVAWQRTRRDARLAQTLVVVGGPQALAPRDLRVAAKVLDHEAAAHNRGEANRGPQRDDLSPRRVCARGGGRLSSEQRVPAHGLPVVGGDTRVQGAYGRTAGLYQIFQTLPLWGPPRGISCQLRTASSHPATHHSARRGQSRMAVVGERRRSYPPKRAKTHGPPSSGAPTR